MSAEPRNLNIANGITIARVLLLAPTAYCLMYAASREWLWTALILATVGFCLDKADGIVARRLGQETPFGALIDPIADKLWLYTLLLILLRSWAASYVGTWIFLVRDLAVTGLREETLARGLVIRAAYLGKLKFRLQAAYVLVSMLMLAMGRGGNSILSVFRETVLIVAVCMTILSGLRYFTSNSRSTSRAG